MGRGKNAILIIHFLPLILSSTSAYPHPLNCTETTRLCTSFLAFKPTSEQTLPFIQIMFDVLQEDITVEGNGRKGYIFIKKKCSCAINKYLTNTTFTVTESNGSVYDLAKDSYQDLVYVQTNNTRVAKKGAVVSLKLMCGCSSSLWNYLMSYIIREGDSVQSLASRFGVSMDSIEAVNGILNSDNVTIGELYFIPLNSG